MSLGGVNKSQGFNFNTLKTAVYDPLKQSGKEVAFGKTAKGQTFAKYQEGDATRFDIFGSGGKYLGTKVKEQSKSVFS